MADVKISDLVAATALTGTELFEIVQGGVSKSITTAKIADEVEALGQYSSLVGDGVAVNISVNHNLNSRNVHVSVRRSTTPWDQVIVDNEATTVNSITLKFGATAPNTDSFIATVSK